MATVFAGHTGLIYRFLDRTKMNLYPGYVTLGKLLHFSGSQLLCLENGENSSRDSAGLS